MKSVFFKPWVGKVYDSGGIFGKRILVLGESQLLAPQLVSVPPKIWMRKRPRHSQGYTTELQ